MRHLKSGRALGVSTSHRRAMMRNMVTSLVETEMIRTTVTRAKEIRKPLDKMITLGKQGDLSARRNALKFVKSKLAMSKLFGELAERYQDRNGGFTRIMRLGPRRGDGAEMAVVVLVGSDKDPFKDEGKGRRKSRGGKAKEKVIDQVAEEVQAAEGEKSAQTKPSTKKKAAEPEAQVTEAEITEEPAAATAEASAEATAGDTPAGETAETEQGESSEEEKSG